MLIYCVLAYIFQGDSLQVPARASQNAAGPHPLERSKTARKHLSPDYAKDEDTLIRIVPRRFGIFASPTALFPPLHRSSSFWLFASASPHHWECPELSLITLHFRSRARRFACPGTLGSACPACADTAGRENGFFSLCVPSCSFVVQVFFSPLRTALPPWAYTPGWPPPR
jgi:hypothetical protein